MSIPATIMLLLTRVDCHDGVASYLESLVTGLSQAGDRVVIVSGNVSSSYGTEFRRRSIEAAVLDWIVLDGFSATRPKPAHMQRILSLISRHKVDVISPQGFSSVPVGYLVGLLSGRPIVTNYLPSVQASEASSMTGELSARQQMAYRLVTAACKSDRYIAMSSDIERFFREKCRIPKERIHKLLLGVETDFYREPSADERRLARTRFGIAEATLVAVLPGRMNLNKGHDVAAAAFRILRERRADIPTLCLFPGGGDQRELIESDVLRDEADRSAFRFLGFVDREMLRDTYWAADIVLLPSRVEGFGLVVAEAMCCGAIVIRTPSGGWQDQVVEGKTGYMVPFNDPAALAVAIETFIDCPDRFAMRTQAMRLASSKFAKSLMIDGTSALYREMAAARRRRHPGSASAAA
jgi:glycosyltransferase involved in cell wall biosynthesis